MPTTFPLSEFQRLFQNDDACLEELKNLRYPQGIRCSYCKVVTHHYKVKKRTSYACKVCRTQTYPLVGTIFAKSTTPLTTWFYAIFLMIQLQGEISARYLEKELGVTYKTAWRIHRYIESVMKSLSMSIHNDLNETFMETLLREAGRVKTLEVVQPVSKR